MEILSDEKVVKLVTKPEIDRKSKKNLLATDIKRAFKAVRESLPDMAGYALVCWDDRGTYTSHYNLENDSNVNALLMPEMVKMVLANSLLKQED